MRPAIWSGPPPRQPDPEWVTSISSGTSARRSIKPKFKESIPSGFLPRWRTGPHRRVLPIWTLPAHRLEPPIDACAAWDVLRQCRFHAQICRRCNEYMAELRRTYPGRLGSFAALPLPDIEGSLIEVAYALDVLHADGVGTWTSYGEHFLGDPMFAPLWIELNRRAAVVDRHPTDSACWPNPIASVMSETVVGFPADTTLAIGSFVFSGTSTRFPDIRFIFSHGGGFMPYAIERFKLEARAPKNRDLLPHGVEHELKRFTTIRVSSIRPARWPRCSTSCPPRRSCSVPISPIYPARMPSRRSEPAACPATTSR